LDQLDLLDLKDTLPSKDAKEILDLEVFKDPKV
jgi:hypothetical protein